MIVSVVIAEAVAIALLALLVAGLLRSHADVLRALHDLGASIDDSPADARPRDLAPATGQPAHDLVGTDPAGAQVGVSVSGAIDALLVFLSTSCYTCQPFWTALREGAAAPAGTHVLVVTRSDEPADAVADLAGDRVAVVMSTQAWADYEVPGSPHVVFVSGGRVRGEGKAASWDRVLDLVTSARAGERSARQWLPDVDLRSGSGTSSPLRGDRDTSSPLRGDRDTSSPLRGDRDNAARIDAELGAAGIGEGDPSLYPSGLR